MKIIALVGFLAFSCSNTKTEKTTFSKEALSETLLATDGSQVAFQDILKKHEGKNDGHRNVGLLVVKNCVKMIPRFSAPLLTPLNAIVLFH
jgi:hypothetical protein